MIWSRFYKVWRHSTKYYVLESKCSVFLSNYAVKCFLVGFRLCMGSSSIKSWKIIGLLCYENNLDDRIDLWIYGFPLSSLCGSIKCIITATFSYVHIYIDDVLSINDPSFGKWLEKQHVQHLFCTYISNLTIISALRFMIKRRF